MLLMLRRRMWRVTMKTGDTYVGARTPVAAVR
jgi:hypothetical protein